MPWSTPTLREVRSLVRDSITGYLPGADASVPNSVLRVLSDVQGALCHLVLQYIDWLALQLMPDTAESEWLDRFGKIWLTNADGSTGRKMATLASGTVTFTGLAGTIVPQFSQLTQGSGSQIISYQTTADVTLEENTPTPAPVQALDPGTIGNQLPGATLALVSPPLNVDSAAIVVELANGTDTETDDELRARVLRRIRQPPMGGSEADYEAWALACPGVTRAWAIGNEMGVGTASVRFMMDDLRADNDGFPLPEDIQPVADYINSQRPVTVKEMYVLAPLKEPVDFSIINLNPDTPAIRGAIESSIEAMLYVYAAPGQTIFAAWKYAAAMAAPGVISFDMGSCADDVMPDAGHMATLGDIYYSTTAPTMLASAKK